MAKTEEYWSFGGVKVRVDSEHTRAKRQMFEKRTTYTRTQGAGVSAAMGGGGGGDGLRGSNHKCDAACVHRLRGRIAAGA